MTDHGTELVDQYDIGAARERIAEIAIQSPVVPSPALGRRLDADVALKLENLQVTGSFKVRGAANKILALSDDERSRGVVTCSSGNHGRAVAYVAELLAIPATVCVPEWIDPVKLEAIGRHGAETVLHGKTYDDAEAKSLEIQGERELCYVHPFDDPYVIAGQGTIGLELLEQLSSLDTVVVPLSGGGLIAGIALALKSRDPTIQVIGVSAENAPVMYHSLRAGRPIEYAEEKTIASALAGGIGLQNRHTFTLVRDYVDEHVLVSETQISNAIAFAAEEHKIVIEGGGAVGIAALLSGRIGAHGKHLAVVVSGGNIDLRSFADLVEATGTT